MLASLDEQSLLPLTVMDRHHTCAEFSFAETSRRPLQGGWQPKVVLSHRQGKASELAAREVCDVKAWVLGPWGAEPVEESRAAILVAEKEHIGAAVRAG